MRVLAVLLLFATTNKPDSIFYHNPLIRETRTKIAIIDSGIILNENTKSYLCNGKHYDLTGTGIEDTISHGTNIAGIIVKQINPIKTCIVVIKYFDYNGDNSKTAQAFRIAKKERVKFVNYSSSGIGSSLAEKDAIKNLLEKKTYVIVASGNNNQPLLKKSCNYYPACYNFNSKFFKVVGNGENGKPQMDSNYGEQVTDWRDGKDVDGFGIKMSGSSQSTALLTGEMAGKE